MQKKKKIILRLNILYLVFFLVLIGSIVASFSQHNVKEGFKEGFKEGMQIHQNDNNIAKSRRFVEIPLKLKNSDFVPSTILADSTEILARPCYLDIKIKGKHIEITSASELLVSLSAFCYLAIFILIFIILLSIRKSIRENNIFNRNNIKLIRAIGVLLIISSLLFDWGRYINIRSLLDILGDASGYFDIIQPGISPKDIIIGILILVIAEIFAIGYDLTEEQKLTI